MGNRTLFTGIALAIALTAPAGRAAPCRVLDVPRLDLAPGRSPPERTPALFGHAAVAWFGDEQAVMEDRVRAYRNYVELRASFSDAGLFVMMSVHDFYVVDLGGPYAPPAGPVTQWDAVELLVEPDAQATSPSAKARRFLVAEQADRGAYLQVIDQTTDAAEKQKRIDCLPKWFAAGRRACEDALPSVAEEPFTQTWVGGGAGANPWSRQVTDAWRYSVANDWGDGCPNVKHPAKCPGGQSGPDGGWYAWLEIPWSALGLASAPAAGTKMKLAARAYDRDDDTGPRATMQWPETLDEAKPATWTTMALEPPAYVPPAVTSTSTVTIGGAKLQEAQTGGHAFMASRWPNAALWGAGASADNGLGSADEDCLDALRDLALTPNGTKTSPQDTLIVHSEAKVTHTCFLDRPLLRFALDDVPAGAAIADAKLHVCHWGNDGQDPADTDPSFRVAGSFVQVHRIEDPWTPGQITWNGTYDASAKGFHSSTGRPVASSENFGAKFIPVHDASSADCVWIDVDVTPAAALAHARGEPLSLALYGADQSANTGKYLRPATNAAAPPTLVVTYGTPTAPVTIDLASCSLGPTKDFIDGPSAPPPGPDAGGDAGPAAGGGGSSGCGCMTAGRRESVEGGALAGLIGGACSLRRRRRRLSLSPRDS
jgi:hypothetical protein